MEVDAQASCRYKVIEDALEVIGLVFLSSKKHHGIIRILDNGAREIINQRVEKAAVGARDESKEQVSHNQEEVGIKGSPCRTPCDIGSMDPARRSGARPTWRR